VKGDPDEFEEEFYERKEVNVAFDNRDESGSGRFNPRPRKRTRRELDKDKMKTFMKNMTSSIGWYMRNVHSVSIKTNFEDLIESEGKDSEIDIQGKIWGWHTMLGIASGLFGFLVLPIQLVMMLSPSVRRFSFIFSFAAAYASLVLIILSAIWWLDTPGWDMKPLVSQQAHVGSYLVMGAGVLVLVFGVMDGVIGLRAFSRSRKV
jgi:hypothetical protein